LLRAQVNMLAGVHRFSSFSYWSMIYSENRFPLFRIMLYASLAILSSSAS